MFVYRAAKNASESQDLSRMWQTCHPKLWRGFISWGTNHQTHGVVPEWNSSVHSGQRRRSDHTCCTHHRGLPLRVHTRTIITRLAQSAATGDRWLKVHMQDSLQPGSTAHQHGGGVTRSESAFLFFLFKSVMNNRDGPVCFSLNISQPLSYVHFQVLWDRRTPDVLDPNHT